LCAFVGMCLSVCLVLEGRSSPVGVECRLWCDCRCWGRAVGGGNELFVNLGGESHVVHACWVK
jgi:hypothetical protein